MVHYRLKYRRGERGQAALLAVVGLLILAIGMYTSYSLSRAVYEKIQLQNAADATAYSLATQEARTFNFIAFANRAQVANYVQMMEMQSLLSSTTFMVGFTGWGGDVSQGFGRLISPLRFVPFLSWVGPIADALIQLGQVLEGVHDSLAPVLDQLDPLVPLYIRKQTAGNQALFAVSLLLALTTTAQLADGGTTWVAANDPDARLNLVSYLVNVINMASYLTAFQTASLSMQSDSEDTKRAKRLIAELSNATRFGGSLGDDFVAARGPFQSLDAVFNVVGGAMSHGGRNSGQLTSLLGPLSSVLNQAVPGFVGTTKLLTSDGDLPDLDDTRNADPERSALSRGGAITAKDISGIRLSAIWKKFASVVSTPDKGEHCRYHKPGAGYGQPWHIGTAMAGDDFKCEDEGGRHQWQALIGKGGIQPYLLFAAKAGGFEVDSSSFNQPDVWVFLNKPPSGMKPSDRDDLHFTLKQGPGMQADLDARIGEDGLMQSGLFEGVNVMARAQVYYHRPGAWQEPPNFFNPFWGGRLAPKGSALKRLSGAIGLPGLAGQLFADNVWMH